MSLTSELADSRSPVHGFMRDRFPDLSAVRKPWRDALTGATTMLPNGNSVPWDLIGTAIDYRIRFCFATAPLVDLVAMHGARNLVTGQPLMWPDQSVRQPDTKLWRHRIEAFAAHHEDLLRSPTADEEALCRHCVILALLDQPYRAGRMPAALADLPAERDLAGLATALDADWIDDLCALSRRFVDTQSHLLTKPAVCNPTFAGSRLIGGADADLVVDRWLLEIKTNKKPSASWETLYQLVGYVLLDFDNRYEIDAVAVYLTRQGVLVRWPLDRYLDALAGEHIDVATTRDIFRRILTARSR